MKRSLFIVCLLLLSLTARGYDNTTHNFSKSGDIARYITNYTVAKMSDSTVYTCLNGATFSNEGGAIRIKVPNNAYVVVSPAKEYLRECYVYHSAGDVNVSIYISTNNSDWIEVTGDNYAHNAGCVRAINLNGDYYVKIVNATGSTIFVPQVNYYTEHQNCNCFPYVPE